MVEFNLFSDEIKFTYEYNKDNILFLDLKVILPNGKLITSLYSKTTVINTERSIAYSQALRIKRVCSQESDFNENSLNLRSWFLKRVYFEKIINTELRKMKFNVDNKRSNNRQKRDIFCNHISPKTLLTNIFIYYTRMRLKVSLHLNLWFHSRAPTKSVSSKSKIISY